MMVPWKRSTLKSDQGPAILAMKTAASGLVQADEEAVGERAATGKTVVTEGPLVRESQANGLTEGAVKESKGFIRSLRWAVEQLHGVVLDSATLVVQWLMRHAGSMTWRRLPPFAEKAMCLKAGRPRSCIWSAGPS